MPPIPTARSASTACLALAVLLAAGFCGCASAGMGSGGPGAGAGAAPAPVAAITVCNQTPGGCSVAASYSLGAMQELAVNVQWSHIDEGTHTATIEILNPQGGVYQMRDVSFLVPAADAPAQTLVRIPVRGTWVAQRSLAGNWNVRVSLDNQPMGTQPLVFAP